MNHLLTNDPLLLLFLVAAIGYFVGAIKIRGASMGTAAVLFVGLLFGMVYPGYEVPRIVFQMGLIFYVYSIGLSSGPAFFESFKTNGFRDMTFIVIMLSLSAVFAYILHFLFGFEKSTTVGVYSGSSTNTTALAGVTDLIKSSGISNANSAVENLVVGYTYSYPMGVFGVMIILKLCEKILKVDYHAEKNILRKTYPIDEDLSSAAIKITNTSYDKRKLRSVYQEMDLVLAFGRILSRDEVAIASWDTTLHVDDVIMVIGSEADIKNAINLLGEQTDEYLIDNYHDYEIKRIFVSNADVVGVKLSSLNLSEKYDAVITRIRRGDVDMIANGDTILEMGDRIRFVAHKNDLASLSKFFGDSYYESSKVNLFSFGLGIALGLILGSIEFAITKDLKFSLGFAGGPLLVGLVMGAFRRTGGILWTLPYSANVTLRQLGLILLLAVIGLQSGHSFRESLSRIDGLNIFIAGTALSMLSAFVGVMIGYKIFKIPFSMLLGFMSNQPAILDYASSMSKNKVPQLGYALMFPISLIMKILFAQALYLLL
jgi:putative transport protein